MKISRKALADLLSKDFGDEISTDQIRKNEARWGLIGARKDSNSRVVRYDLDKALKAFRKFIEGNKPHVPVVKESIKTPEERRKYKIKRLAIRFGLSESELNKMFLETTSCGICGNVFGSIDKGAKIKPVLDHCHNTEKIRGIICGRCNVALGMVGDNPAVLSRMIEYIGKFKNQVANSAT